MKTYFTYECECCGKKFHEKSYPKAINPRDCARINCENHEKECKKLHDEHWALWFADLTRGYEIGV